MMARTQIALHPEVQHRARQRAGDLGVSFAEYLRRLVVSDAERDQARARIEDSIKIIESTHSETEAAWESLNVVLLSIEERQAGICRSSR
jgi:hypothetical protein